jgi:hypothetical protein
LICQLHNCVLPPFKLSLVDGSTPARPTVSTRVSRGDWRALAFPPIRPRRASSLCMLSRLASGLPPDYTVHPLDSSSSSPFRGTIILRPTLITGSLPSLAMRYAVLRLILRILAATAIDGVSRSSVTGPSCRAVGLRVSSPWECWIILDTALRELPSATDARR